MSKGFTVRGVDPQVDGDGRDALVGAGDPVGLRLDLQPNLLKVHKFAAFAVKELGIFCGIKGANSDS